MMTENDRGNRTKDNGYQREKKLLVDALVQKGSTIIRFINSSSRESMRADFSGSQPSSSWQAHVRAVMEQAVEQPGVDYVALVDPQNRIVLSAGDTSSRASDSTSTLEFLSTLKDRNRRTFISRNVEEGESR
ncbi:MAG: hypothetical protein JRJ68_11165, partial [Deltaproteobacteria bacterium]|nr:hypothetical protein [Deltaproteobacteria bacterium]